MQHLLNLNYHMNSIHMEGTLAQHFDMCHSFCFFDPKHGFLSSVEAEIISFCQRRQPFAFSAFYVHPLTFESGSPSKFDKWDLETWLKKRFSSICSITMFNTILFYAFTKRLELSVVHKGP